MLKYGVDRANEFAHLFSGRVALVTSPTGRDSLGRSTAEVLKDICDLRLLLAPEHGIRGNRAAGEAFGEETDEETGLPVLSLYSGSSKRLPEDAFSLADAFVYDIQDVGCRYYTFISTLKLLMEDCAAHEKRLIVLDRPNPLGDRVEGNLLLPEMTSFVGCHDIPVIYGLTCGEFARMAAAECHRDCDLHIIPCEGWTRNMTFPTWKKDWVKPSPNIPDYQTTLIYPGTCLIEGTNLSEGRGTPAPFATIGAPFVDGELLCRKLNIPGLQIEPIRFTPSASKFAGTECSGIRLQITDEAIFRPTEFGLRLLHLLMTQYPDDLTLTPGEGLPFLSQLAGHRKLETPNWNPDDQIAAARRECEDFRTRMKKYQLYAYRL